MSDVTVHDTCAGSLGLCSNLAQVNGTNATLSVLGGTTSPTATQPQFPYAFSACQDPGSNGVTTLRIFGFGINLAQVPPPPPPPPLLLPWICAIGMPGQDEMQLHSCTDHFEVK